MDCVNTQENKFKSMENDYSSISLQKFSYKEEEELSESMKFCVFKLPTTNNDEHVPLGKSQPWKLVDRTIGKINLHLERNIPSFLDQPTEINRHIYEPSDTDTNTHFLYFAANTVQLEFINDPS